ncbi:MULTISPECIES: MarR family winged helix-turn-helix transcriptional regulator [Streptomyces]|uniref:MarR family winged helix-turn-helix transcriptional regulator n=1 Tax=Streptomyces TaxID=1883 RepID=UPI001315B952|nr:MULTISPECIES: MarR family transcriptional regulator [Streptomyces]QGZ47587.1 MarR family transcriptional regulator [Streptomyces sp. QHH-9511]
MSRDPGPRPKPAKGAAQAASAVIELLEVLWEQSNDVTASSSVSASQLRVMYCLEREEGMNLRRLGHLLGAAPPSVSRLCDRLEAMGFVERTPSQVSRRELTLCLTSRGKTHLAELRALRQEILMAPIQNMPPAARAALLDGLSAFREALEDAEAARAHTPARTSPQSA